MDTLLPIVQSDSAIEDALIFCLISVGPIFPKKIVIGLARKVFRSAVVGVCKCIIGVLESAKCIFHADLVSESVSKCSYDGLGLIKFSFKFFLVADVESPDEPGHCT